VKAFLAILKQTIRSSVRSKVFLVLFALILLCVVGLPLTIRGDNTAAGLIQVSLTYSLNLVVALISASCLWLGCSLLASEIEGYQVHLTVTKPCPRWVLWTGKFVGVFLMHAIILVISMLLVYGLTFFRLDRAHKAGLFNEDDMARLNREFLVARREFRPRLPDLSQRVQVEYEKRVRQGLVDPKSTDELAVKKAIMQDLIEGVLRNTTLKPGETATWEYKGVKLPSDDATLSVRLRAYSNDAINTNQNDLTLDVGFLYFGEAGETAGIPTVWYTEGIGAPFVAPGGVWRELSTIAPNTPKNAEGQYVVGADTYPTFAKDLVNKDHENSVSLTIRNLGDIGLPARESIPQDEESLKAYDRAVRSRTAVFQAADGPTLLCPVGTFGQNYARTMVMALYQLAFLAALGCTVGALFSTPVAVFAAIAYLIIGLVVPFAMDAPVQGPDGSYMYANMWERAAHYMATTVQTLVVTVDDLNTTGDLAAGRLVEAKDLGWAFLRVIVIRSGLLAGLGIYFLTRRELGLVVRRIS
jgi:hypothetical protein